MENSRCLSDLSDRYQSHQHHRRARMPIGESSDDECSTDSGCSSGGSIGSGGLLFCRDRDRRSGRISRSPKSNNHCYLEVLRAGRRATRSQNRGGSAPAKSSESRGWSPEDVRSLQHDGISPASYSSDLSDAHSSSDSDSLKRHSTTETLKRAFQSLKITASNSKKNKHAKKNPKRILRSPVPYMYVRGPSGLPTQRVPRNINGLQSAHPYSCQNLIGLYR